MGRNSDSDVIVDLVQLTVWLQAWTTIRTSFSTFRASFSTFRTLATFRRRFSVVFGRFGRLECFGSKRVRLGQPLDQTTCLDERNSDADSDRLGWSGIVFLD